MADLQVDVDSVIDRLLEGTLAFFSTEKENVTLMRKNQFEVLDRANKFNYRSMKSGTSASKPVKCL